MSVCPILEMSKKEKLLEDVSSSLLLLLPVGKPTVLKVLVKTHLCHTWTNEIAIVKCKICCENPSEWLTG